MITNEYIDKRLYRAYFEAQRGKQGTGNEHEFEMNFVENLHQLREDIVRRTYKPSRGIAFITHDPVDREIFAAPFRDRVIHHFICDYIVDWWERHFIDASYSCRKGKGTDAGVRDLYCKMRKVSKNFHEPTVVVKIDMSSYFCSISHKKLFERVDWGLKKQFLYNGCTPDDRDIYQMLKFLCREVIFDDPTRDVIRKGGIEAWKNYPRRKSLFYQKPGKGIVIGNLTSQVFSNVYLDQFDRFVLFELGEKNYGRYVDDAFFVMPESERENFIKEKLPKLIDFASGLDLVLNPKKTFCQNIEKGIPFLGVIVYPYRVLPGKRLAKNFKNSIYKVHTQGKEMDGFVSYLGRMKHIDAQNFIEQSFEKFSMEYKRSRNGNLGSTYFTDYKNFLEKQKRTRF